MADPFSVAEWSLINNQLTGNEANYDFPAQRNKSVILASFNIRDFGKKAKRTDGAWALLIKMIEAFDFVAVQEVEDNLESLDHLTSALRQNGDWGRLYSDIGGATPGQISGISPHERLAFLYRRDRFQPLEMASDITFDRSYVFKKMLNHRKTVFDKLEKYAAELKKFKAGTRKTKPYFLFLPAFFTFIRPPHCASFRLLAKGGSGAAPIDFTAVNAHLLYGGGRKTERRREFNALVEWLLDRAKKVITMPVRNILLMGDLNFDFSAPVAAKRLKLDKKLRDLNRKLVTSDLPAEFNFPFLDGHPVKGLLRSNARRSETYDHIAFIRHDTRLPDHDANATVTGTGDGFDYGRINFVQLFVDVIRGGVDVTGLSRSEKDAFYGRFDRDVSDHMPIWVRLPIPGA